MSRSSDVARDAQDWTVPLMLRVSVNSYLLLLQEDSEEDTNIPIREIGKWRLKGNNLV
jgi:SPX domain protein involved in polyphosphate accumulation